MKRRDLLKLIIGVVVGRLLPLTKSVEQTLLWTYDPPIELKAGVTYILNSSGICAC